ncbi:MAG: hypothetical protein R3240_07685 [Gammaproteobacteria bacterium]|nr:hypothetical protein [Gammaproteobacteria bacterium]
MAPIKQISGSTTNDIWQQVTADLSGQDIFEYNVSLVQNGREVELVIDIDPGGGFESGYQYTSFKAPVASEHDFRFALHHQGLIDTAGKFFGMEDVVIGYPEFDEALIIKTDDRERTHRIFSDVQVRETFQSLRLFTLHLTHHHIAGQKGKKAFLELTIEEGVVDPAVLRNLYDAFYKVLSEVEAG